MLDPNLNDIFYNLICFLQTQDFLSEFKITYIGFKASIGNENLEKEVNQVLIRDLPNEIQNNNNFVFKKLGFVVKYRDTSKPEIASQISKKIEQLFSAKMGGQLIENGLNFGIIRNTQPSVFIGSVQAHNENTSLFESQFQFTYRDTQLLNNYNINI